MKLDGWLRLWILMSVCWLVYIGYDQYGDLSVLYARRECEFSFDNSGRLLRSLIRCSEKPDSRTVDNGWRCFPIEEIEDATAGLPPFTHSLPGLPSTRTRCSSIALLKEATAGLPTPGPGPQRTDLESLKQRDVYKQANPNEQGAMLAYANEENAKRIEFAEATSRVTCIFSLHESYEPYITNELTPMMRREPLKYTGTVVSVPYDNYVRARLRRFVKTALVQIFSLVALGWGVAWVRRGFRGMR
jgi:hypothetical protein